MLQIIADIKVQHPAEVCEKLNAAVAAAHADVSANRRNGILVTRHDYDHFTVALSPNVPYGIVKEKDETRRP